MLSIQPPIIGIFWETKYHRGEWWAQESLSPASQRLYSRVVNFAQIGKGLKRGDLVADLCCGPGELLRRLYSITGLVVGTDMDMEMLRIAEERLKQRGIPTTVIERPEDPDFRVPRVRFQNGVYLVQDNVLNTKISPNTFDHVFLVLPDILGYGVLFTSDTPVSDEEETHFYERRTRSTIMDLLKKHGRVTECHFDGHIRDHREVSRLHVEYRYGGQAEYLRHKFYPDHDIARYALDAGSDSENIDGYLVFTLKKPKQGSYSSPAISF